MPLPIDIAGAWKAQNAFILRDVGYREFDPATDTHATAVDCVGVRGQKRKTEEAGAKTVRATWRVTGLDAEPVMRSLIVDGADSWVIETVTPDPVSESLFKCECYLG